MHQHQGIGQGTFSLSVRSATSFGPASDTGLALSRTMSTLQSAVKWLKKEKTGSSVQNKARHLALACTVYTLWRHRNESHFRGLNSLSRRLIKFSQGYIV
ncbi:UNVERIFIED_CONTAM: hypothetical protein Sindi_2964700 [Sesamum indicum]